MSKETDDSTKKKQLIEEIALAVLKEKQDGWRQFYGDDNRTQSASDRVADALELILGRFSVGELEEKNQIIVGTINASSFVEGRGENPLLLATLTKDLNLNVRGKESFRLPEAGKVLSVKPENASSNEAAVKSSQQEPLRASPEPKTKQQKIIDEILNIPESNKTTSALVQRNVAVLTEVNKLLSNYSEDFLEKNQGDIKDLTTKFLESNTTKKEDIVKNIEEYVKVCKEAEKPMKTDVAWEVSNASAGVQKASKALIKEAANSLDKDGKYLGAVTQEAGYEVALMSASSSLQKQYNGQGAKDVRDAKLLLMKDMDYTNAAIRQEHKEKMKGKEVEQKDRASPPQEKRSWFGWVRDLPKTIKALWNRTSGDKAPTSENNVATATVNVKQKGNKNLTKDKHEATSIGSPGKTPLIRPKEKEIVEGETVNYL